MHEKRASQRIALEANGVLQYQNQRFPCHVENISLNGALVGVEDAACDLVYQGEACVLSLRLDEGGAGVDLNARVVHGGFGLVGLKFCERDAAQEEILAAIVGKMEGPGGRAGRGDASHLYNRLGINTEPGQGNQG